MTRYLRERALFGALIEPPPSEGLGLVVVIPAKDEEELVTSLMSLRDCEQPACDVEVIVVANTGETDSPECIAANQRMAEEAKGWAREHSTTERAFHVLQCYNLPKKHAGVGLARKIGMDEACRRLEYVGNPRGVIACFDADSTCSPNYLVELDALFRRDEDCQACSIRFEHPTSGDAFPQELYDAVVLYELHLRYFVAAQRWTGFPFATQTIGSSMAVRCDAYQEQNGMNRRKAGEDFYFLHKYTPLRHVAELDTTCVIPSPRRSHRVPFGTGKAVGEILDTDAPFLTYAPESFRDLKVFFDSVDALAANDVVPFPESVTSFLATQPFQVRLDEIRENVTTTDQFRVRFFRWFNAFLIMKFVHHARDGFYPDVEVDGAARWLMGETRAEAPPANARELLGLFRAR